MAKSFVVEADILLSRLIQPDHFIAWHNAVERASVESWHSDFLSASQAYYAALDLFNKALQYNAEWTACLQSSALAANNLCRLHSLARCFFGKMQLPTQHNKEVRRLLRYAKRHLGTLFQHSNNDSTSIAVRSTILATVFVLCSLLDCITIPPGNTVCIFFMITVLLTDVFWFIFLFSLVF